MLWSIYPSLAVGSLEPSENLLNVKLAERVNQPRLPTGTVWCLPHRAALTVDATLGMSPGHVHSNQDLSLIILGASRPFACYSIPHGDSNGYLFQSIDAIYMRFGLT